MDSTSTTPEVAMPTNLGNPATLTVNRFILVLCWLGFLVA